MLADRMSQDLDIATWKPELVNHRLLCVELFSNQLSSFERSPCSYPVFAVSRQRTIQNRLIQSRESATE